MTTGLCGAGPGPRKSHHPDWRQRVPVEEAFQNVVPQMHRAHSMEEAVRLAHEVAQPGDVVLLSPACASFDWYRSYEERGEAFVKAVQTLAKDISETPPPQSPTT